MRSVSTGPPPALFTLRSPIPSRSPSARAQARPVLPPSAHRQSATQPPSPIPRSHPDPPAAPLRDHPPAHTRPPAPALTHAHTHTSTPPRTHPHHTRTLSRHAPGRPHMPALLRCTHSRGNFIGLWNMSKDRPPPYDIPEAGRYYRCGRVMEWGGRGGRARSGRGTRWGRSGVPLLALSDQRKKVAKNRAFFFRKFCKVHIFAYICIEKNTKPIPL